MNLIHILFNLFNKKLISFCKVISSYIDGNYNCCLLIIISLYNLKFYYPSIKYVNSFLVYLFNKFNYLRIILII